MRSPGEQWGMNLSLAYGNAKLVAAVVATPLENVQNLSK
jgi:hypothetical protein